MQTCKYGRVQHLEHLLFYGAEMNSQNSSGNTPLHVSAVNNQVKINHVLSKLLYLSISDKGIKILITELNKLSLCYHAEDGLRMA